MILNKHDKIVVYFSVKDAERKIISMVFGLWDIDIFISLFFWFVFFSLFIISGAQRGRYT